jgi:hypothetical protein
VHPPPTEQVGLFRSATLTLLWRVANHQHTPYNDIDSEIKGRQPDTTLILLI